MEIKEYYRQKRRSAVFYKIGIYFSGSLMAIVVLWAFFWVPYFRVKNILIENYTDNNDIKSALEPHFASLNKFFLPQNNFFLLNKAWVGRILKDSGFGAPEISKKFPRTLIVSFVQEKPWLIFCHADNSCFYVGKKGVLGERAPRFSDNPLPELTVIAPENLKIGDFIISESQADYINTLFNAFLGVNAVPVKVEVLNTAEAKIFVAEGWFILTSFGLDPAKISQDLKLLLDQKIGDKRHLLEYIDMRFLNKAFYKLKSVN